MSAHDERIKREFTKQAASFEDPAYSFADRRLMGWIQSHVPAEPGALVLDVAGGTGHMARAYAANASAAVVIDLTEAMLATGRLEAEAEGRRNVLFMRGDAAHLEFVDDSFDLVLSRFAVHHFERPQEQVGEMVRVCRPNGRVAIIDLVAADPALAAEQDRIERMRDPSHTAVHSMSELRALLEHAGASAFHETFHDQQLAVERWLGQTDTPQDTADAIRSELRRELDGAAATGMRPVVEEGKLRLTHRYAIVVARA
jgi:ubiquinone/menaquinone biosynthesis C-methylase UbiE